jgi:hypothetical protein
VGKGPVALPETKAISGLQLKDVAALIFARVMNAPLDCGRPQGIDAF